MKAYHYGIISLGAAALSAVGVWLAYKGQFVGIVVATAACIASTWALLARRRQSQLTGNDHAI